MRKDLVAHWREDIIGDWRSELVGVDLLHMEPSANRFTLALSLRSDGTATYDFTIPNRPAVPPEAVAPFPERWELSDDRVLSIWLPLAPMPKYGIPDWTDEQVCYDVLAVTDLSLTLSNRRFDGESVYVLRRADVEAYDRRKYGDLMQAAKQWANPG